MIEIYTSVSPFIRVASYHSDNSMSSAERGRADKYNSQRNTGERSYARGEELTSREEDRHHREQPHREEENRREDNYRREYNNRLEENNIRREEYRHQPQDTRDNHQEERVDRQDRRRPPPEQGAHGTY